jgi:hypothetical protein
MRRELAFDPARALAEPWIRQSIVFRQVISMWSRPAWRRPALAQVLSDKIQVNRKAAVQRANPLRANQRNAENDVET